jgi:hypothetical protein
MDRPVRPVAGCAIDWAPPWFAPWRAAGERVEARVTAGLPLHEALNLEAAAPVRFVAASVLPAGQAYEHFVFGSGLCPVRPGLHDFFNGLAWLGLPQAKAQLNRVQAAEIGALGVGAVRGPVRDAITLFDENGALLAAPPEIWAALLERNWHRLFVQLRPLWSQVRLTVVGHALLEKLVAPRKALTAHVWCDPVALDSLAVADPLLAARLTRTRLADKPFAPLPLLGVPGWWAQNEAVSFYDDVQVFRPRRTP